MFDNTTLLDLAQDYFKDKLKNEQIKLILKEPITEETYNITTEILTTYSKYTLEEIKTLQEDLKTIREIFKEPFYQHLSLNNLVGKYIANRDVFFIDLWYDLIHYSWIMEKNNCSNKPGLAKIFIDGSYARNVYDDTVYKKPFFKNKEDFEKELINEFLRKECVLYLYLLIGNTNIKHEKTIN